VGGVTDTYTIHTKGGQLTGRDQLCAYRMYSCQASNQAHGSSAKSGGVERPTATKVSPRSRLVDQAVERALVANRPCQRGDPYFLFDRLRQPGAGLVAVGLRLCDLPAASAANHRRGSVVAARAGRANQRCAEGDLRNGEQAISGEPVLALALASPAPIHWTRGSESRYPNRSHCSVD
jgi:hypothetical protein